MSSTLRSLSSSRRGSCRLPARVQRVHLRRAPNPARARKRLKAAARQSDTGGRRTATKPTRPSSRQNCTSAPPRLRTAHRRHGLRLPRCEAKRALGLHCERARTPPPTAAAAGPRRHARSGGAGRVQSAAQGPGPAARTGDGSAASQRPPADGRRPRPGPHRPERPAAQRAGIGRPRRRDARSAAAADRSQRPGVDRPLPRKSRARPRDGARPGHRTGTDAAR